jgi:hypothetical protein
MFEEIWDRLSLVGAFRWPVATGEITAVEIERVGQNRDRPRLSVAYEFSVGEDGPYTGECFWEPMFSLTATRSIRTALHKLRLKQPIEIRYRADDPSVNTGNSGLREILR